MPCQLGKASADKAVVMIGDSILAQWYPAIAEHYNKLGWRLVVLTKSSCPMVNRPYYYPRIKSEFKVCEAWRAKALQFIAEMKPDTVIMGSSARYSFGKSAWVEGTREIIEQLVPHVSRIELMAGTPALPFNGQNCLVRLDQISRRIFISPRSGACSSAVTPAVSISWIEDLASQYSGVKFIDLNNEVCPNGICVAEIENQLVFRDGQHLTAGFVMRLAERLSEALSEEPHNH